MFLLIALSGVVFGQRAGTISGRVADANGDAIAGAIVSLSGDAKMTAATDRSGRFVFTEVPYGDYRLTIDADSFASIERVISVPYRGSIAITLFPESLAEEVSITSNYIAGSPDSLMEVPGAVERLDRELLERSRLFDFSEALRKISGLNVRDEEGFGLRPNIGIRGTNPTRSMKVLLLEDGVPLSYAPYGDNASYYHPPVERYTAIEVMKGSSQIAFGPQTIAGVVNYLTPNPTKKPAFGLKLIGGSRSFFNGSVQGSGTLGRTGIFASYTQKQGVGSRENISSRLNDILTKVVHSVNDRHSFTFKGSYFGEDSNVTYSGLTEAEFALSPRANPFRNDHFYGDRFGFSASHAAILTNAILLSTNLYANFFSRDWWRQSSNSGQRPNRLNIDPDCLSMADLNTTCGNEGRLRDYRTIGFEPKLLFSYGSDSGYRGELQAGFRLHWEHQDRRQENGDLPTSRSGPASEINVRENRAVAGFVQNRFVLGQFAITPGVRFERINIARRNLLTTPVSGGETLVHAVVPGVGVAYSGLSRLTLFAGVHRGYSPPRAEDMISNSGGIIELDPEKSWNYEAGFRADPFRGLHAEATLFRLDYSNQIVAASLAGGSGSTLTNGGATLQQGFEFSGSIATGDIFRSRHNVYLRSAATWLPVAEFRGVRFSSVSPAVSVAGNRLPYTPRAYAATSLGYSHSNGFDIFAENVFIGRQFSDDLNSVDPVPNGQRGAIGPQNYWNATVNYSVERWRTTFFVTGKNLSDRTFVVDRSRGLIPSNGRSIHAGLSIKF